MTETEQLIRQAARELGIEDIRISEVQKGVLLYLVAEFKRKDGSEGRIIFNDGISYSELIEQLKAEHKSEVSAEAAKAKRIAGLIDELKELKGE